MKIKFFFVSLFLLNLLIISNNSFADEIQYDIKIKDGGIFNNHFVKNISKDKSLITISDGKSLISIPKTEIEYMKKSDIVVDHELIKKKEIERSNAVKFDQCDYGYMSGLGDGDIYNIKMSLHDKLSILLNNKEEMLVNSVRGKYGNGGVKGRAEYINNENQISRYENCMKTLDRIFSKRESSNIVKRGVDAKYKLDKGEYSTPSDIENLIDDKVKMDMILNDK